MKKFANWARKKFRKEATIRIVFSDEKIFDLDGIYNSQNDRIWAVNREKVNRRRGKSSKESLQKRCGYGYPYAQRVLRPLFRLKKALEHHRYVKEVPSVAL